MRTSNEQKEAMRNRLLRRVDWRFLLPNPQPKRIACFASGLLADAVALLDGAKTGEPSGSPAECDLVVAVNPDQAMLQLAWATLSPGGVCYTEWRHPWAGGAQGVRRQLTAAGFTDVVCYWAWPWPERGNPLFWLPLEAPQALRYFLANRPPSRAWGMRMARMLYRTLWRMGLRTRFVTPICAIAQKPGALAAPELTAWIRTQWRDWDWGPTPAHLSSLLLTGGLRSINKVVRLLFADAECTPRLILKMPRAPESLPALTHEVAILQAVHAKHPRGLTGMPRILFCQEMDGVLTVGETALTGVPIWTQLRQANFRHCALQVTDWLIQLAGQPPRCQRQKWWGRLVEPVLTEFAATFGPVIDGQALQATTTLLDALGDLPQVCEQRDCSPWNVLVAADGELIVLDWESAELDGLPLLDLIYFLTYLAFFLEGAMESGDYRAVYRALWHSTSRLSCVAQECVARYSNALGLDSANLRPLRLFTWLLHARSEYKQFTADAGHAPTAEALRRSLFLSLWEEELANAHLA